MPRWNCIKVNTPARNPIVRTVSFQLEPHCYAEMELYIKVNTPARNPIVRTVSSQLEPHCYAEMELYIKVNTPARNPIVRTVSSQLCRDGTVYEGKHLS